MGLLFGRQRQRDAESAQISAYADADWGTDKADRKSVTGWLATVNGDPVSWASKKQSVVALSSCEAELYAECSAVQEALWLQGLFKELGFTGTGTAVLYEDNQSAMRTAKNGVRSERTKHVDIKYHFITDVVESGKVRIEWIPSAQQPADIFTKALHTQQFMHLREGMMQ
jgi:hypothetical protein